MSDAGNLHAKVFAADFIKNLPGTSYMAQAFALVALDFVVPPVGKSKILHAESATGPFQEADYLLIRSLDHRAEPLAVMNAWFKIVSIIEENTFAPAASLTAQRSGGDSDHPHSIWVLEHVHGGKVGAVIGKGNTLVNFGQSTEPWITFTGLLPTGQA
jgi:hypothetical protein